MLLKFFLSLISLSLISFTFSTQCRDGSYCPGRQTCCLSLYGVGCCPYEDAICCGDGVHCCPNGFICGDYSCYKQTGDANLAFFLSNSKENNNNFLDKTNNNSINKNNSQIKESNDNNNKLKLEEQSSSEKINKILVNFSSNSRTNTNKNSNLEFLEPSNSNSNNEYNKNKEVEILSASASKTTTATIIEENSGKISASIATVSKFAAILNKIDFLNNSYLKKLLGCFKDIEPIINDLMNAIKQKNENKTESLMKLVTELVSKMYFDGAKITSDCKALLALAGIAGIF